MYMDSKIDQKARPVLHQSATTLFKKYSRLLFTSGHPHQSLQYTHWYCSLLLNNASDQINRLMPLPVAPDGDPIAFIEYVSTLSNIKERLFQVDLKTTSFDEIIERVEGAADLAYLCTDASILTDFLFQDGQPLSRYRDRPWRTRCASLARRTLAMDSYMQCERILHDAIVMRKGGDGESLSSNRLGAVYEIHALVIGRRIQIEMNARLEFQRFGWLTIAVSEGPEQAAELFDKLDRDCVMALELLRVGPTSARGRRIKSYLHSIRGVILSHKYPGNQQHHADVVFRRSQSSLRRPFSAADRSAFGTALLTEAECKLVVFRSLVGEHFKAATAQVPAMGTKPLGIDGDNVIDGEVDAVSLSETDLSSIFPLQEQVRILLEQATSILGEGRSENRWRTYNFFLQASYHVAVYSSLLGNQRYLGRRREQLRSALRRTIAALTNTGKWSDRRVVLHALFMVIDAYGSRDFGLEGWMAEKRLSGIPGWTTQASIIADTSNNSETSEQLEIRKREQLLAASLAITAKKELVSSHEISAEPK